MYTSVTGYSTEDSAGSVQLATLICSFCTSKYIMRDLGIEMEYKKKLGSELIPQKDYVTIVHSVREQYEHLIPTESTKTKPNNNNTIAYRILFTLRCKMESQNVNNKKELS